jgi:ABC-type bacteriocin/lantibiotic exporter with double-glycine peptidase domain
MVLRFFERDLPAPELFRRLGTGRDGTRQNSIVRELRRANVSANIRYDVDFERLRTAINRDKPIIGYLDDDEHWLVIYGYGLDPARVFVADPRPNQRCEHLWGQYGPRLNQFGIVCSARNMEQAINDNTARSPEQTAASATPELPAADEPRAAPPIAQLSFDFLGLGRRNPGDR